MQEQRAPIVLSYSICRVQLNCGLYCNTEEYRHICSIFQPSEHCVPSDLIYDMASILCAATVSPSPLSHTHMLITYYIYSHGQIIGTLGKYDKSRLEKCICIVNPCDLLFKKIHKNITFHFIGPLNKNFKWGGVSFRIVFFL